MLNKLRFTLLSTLDKLMCRFLTRARWIMELFEWNLADLFLETCVNVSSL